MIVTALLEIVWGIIQMAFIGLTVMPIVPVEIPPLPDTTLAYIDQFLDYLSLGASIIGNYINLPYTATIFGIIVVVDIVLGIYNLVMWILNKIPVANVDR